MTSANRLIPFYVSDDASQTYILISRTGVDFIAVKTVVTNELDFPDTFGARYDFRKVNTYIRRSIYNEAYCTNFLRSTFN